MNQVMHELATNFRLVVADLGPLSRWADDHPRCDQMVLVRDVRRTSSEELDAAVSKMEFAGVQVLGVIENFSEGDGQWARPLAA
jgi:Mrp family chromosome partitioning ATPase